jgi:hypothetical protein
MFSETVIFQLIREISRASSATCPPGAFSKSPKASFAWASEIQKRGN